MVMPAQRILLLEDDGNLGFILKEHLELHGYVVDLRTNGVDGMNAFAKGRFALCLVDVMMPRKDGFTFARELRAKDADIPFIFLTAKSLKEDRVEGLKIGADDYVTKPFSMEELMLRIHAVLRRSRSQETASPPPTHHAIGTFRFDSEARTLRHGDTVEELTSREAELLQQLCMQGRGVLERSVALRQIWGTDSFFAGRSMDVFISKLRKRLAADLAVHIVNVHGKGFRLVVTGEKSSGVVKEAKTRTRRGSVTAGIRKTKK
jgi:DNA-binding response OmpR family regulator